MVPPYQWTSCMAPSLSSGGTIPKSALIAVAPGFGQVADGEIAFEHGQLEVESQHDVQVVGDFVGFDADQRSLDLVDCPIEGLQRHLTELFGEDGLKPGIVELPETPAAPDPVLPKARLALVNPRRSPVCQGRALVICA